MTREFELELKQTRTKVFAALAREFWERCFVARLGANGNIDATVTGNICDRAMEEWKQRFDKETG